MRNPFDKLVSGFFMFQSREGLQGDEIRCFKAWLQSFMELVKKNRSLVEAYDVPHYLKPIELALLNRDKYLIDGEECVDHFIRHESLAQDIENVCDKLNVQFEAHMIPEFKKGVRHHRISIQEYFDIQSQDIVQDLYEWEITRFNYSLPS